LEVKIEPAQSEAERKMAITQCITLRDIARLTNDEIHQFVASAEQYRTDPEGGCADFYKKVRSLESWITTSYKFAVHLAKQTESVNELREIWKETSDICDSVLKEMKSLKDSFPQCGTVQLYDLVLSFKNAAFSRYRQHLEALQWEKEPIPAGLFPKSS
jgi:hypothetical protein